MRQVRFVIAAAGLTLIAGCQTTVTGTASPTTASASASSAAGTPSEPPTNNGSWPQKTQVNAIAIGPPPQFPSSLAHWTLHQSWSVTPRAFEDQQTKVSGPGYGDYPSTMNGCDEGRFLVRWRIVGQDSTVTSLLLDDGGRVTAQSSGTSGWMDTDGCETPAFEFADSTDGANLTDVTVQVQEWWPAP